MYSPDPSTAADHLGGLFFVGLEWNGLIYAHTLNVDGTYSRVATINTGFGTIMDMSFDRDRGDFWAVCDNTCNGQMEQLTVGADGHFGIAHLYNRPAAMPNRNNEGFTITSDQECTNGLKSAFWFDDPDDDGIALRSGTVPCSDTTPPTITAAVSAGTLGSNGWYTSDVTVSFTCTDNTGGSGIAVGACPSNQILTTEGASVSAMPETVSDIAGNVSAPSNVVTVKIDKTPPSISITGVTDGQTLSSAVSPTISITDGVSGIDPTQATITLSTDIPTRPELRSASKARAHWSRCGGPRRQRSRPDTSVHHHGAAGVHASRPGDPAPPARAPLRHSRQVAERRPICGPSRPARCRTDSCSTPPAGLSAVSRQAQVRQRLPSNLTIPAQSDPPEPVGTAIHHRCTGPAADHDNQPSRRRGRHVLFRRA